MANNAYIPVGEYLKAGYGPDRDYVDGQIEERNSGEYDHAALQAALIIWFGQHQREWNIEVLPEQRMQIPPSGFAFPISALYHWIVQSSKFLRSLRSPVLKYSLLGTLCGACRSSSPTTNNLA
jgi:hypothetical protein